MNRLLRFISRQVQFELKLGYLLPIFVGLGILLNAQIANASALNLPDFAPVAIRPSRYADYSRDPLDLQFAPIDPSIIEGAQLDKAPNIDADAQAPEAPSFGSPTPLQLRTSTPQPTATQQISLPTLPLPTLPPLPPIIPTLLPIVPTLLPIIPTVVAPIIDVLPTLIPLLPCIPIPLIQSCN